MWLRRKRTSRDVLMEELSAEDGKVLPVDSRDPGPSPEDSYLEREWKQILYQAMNELSPAIRTAMEL